MSKNKNSLFSKGYGAVRERIRSNSYYTRSCLNCTHYYQAVGDKEEACQNNSVLEYDIIVEGHTVYCTQWEMNNRKENSLFKKKTGRDKLD